MSKRQAYARVTVSFAVPSGDPIEVIAGIELHPYEPLRSQYDRLRKATTNALSPSSLRNYSDADINAAVERAIIETFGTRPSYFIEVGRGKLDEYVQVFLP